MAMAPTKRSWDMDMSTMVAMATEADTVVVAMGEGTVVAMVAIHQDMVGMVADTVITMDMVGDTVITLGMVVDMVITLVMVVNIVADMEDMVAEGILERDITVAVVAPVAVGTEMKGFTTIVCFMKYVLCVCILIHKPCVLVCMPRISSVRTL